MAKMKVTRCEICGEYYEHRAMGYNKYCDDCKPGVYRVKNAIRQARWRVRQEEK